MQEAITNADQLASVYERDGYVAPVRVLSEADAKRYRREMEDFEKQLGRPLNQEERTKPHLLFKWAADLCRHPEILKHVQPILGDDILAWESVLFTKEPNGKEYITWHQDIAYWGLDPADEILTAWVALSPSTKESGCMRVVPGSQNTDILKHNDTYAEGNLLSRGQELAVDVDEKDAVDLVLQPGEMSLHHTKIFHGSDKNTSNDRRIGFAIRYFSTSVKQKSPKRDSAFLVSGVDRFGHFDLEPAPATDYSDDARSAHQEFRRRRRELQASI